MNMPKQQVGFYVWQPRQNHCLDFLRQIGAIPSGYGTTTWHFDFAASWFFRKTLFLDLFFICFIVLWKCFAFFYFLEELFWFENGCSDSGRIVLVWKVLFWTAAQTRAKPGYPYGKKAVQREVCRRGQGRRNENRWRRQYLSARRKDIERTKQNPIALYGFTDHNSTPTQSKSCLNNVALGAS